MLYDDLVGRDGGGREAQEGGNIYIHTHTHAHTYIHAYIFMASQVAQWEESTCSAGDSGDAGSTPGSGRSPGGGHGNALQYSCLDNPMDRGALQATLIGTAVLQLSTWLICTVVQQKPTQFCKVIILQLKKFQ